MTPDLRYDQEGEKRRAKIINGMAKTNKKMIPGARDTVLQLYSETEKNSSETVHNHV